MRKKIKKSTKIFVIEIFAFIILNVFRIDFSKSIVLQNDFLITFLLTVIGIFLAIITLMYGLIDKINKIFKQANLDSSFKKIYGSFNETKENTLLIVYIMIVLFVISIFSEFDIPYFSFPSFINKNIFIYNLKFILLSLCLIAIYDTVRTFFIILDISHFNQ